MEVKNSYIRNMKHEDFKDNEYLDAYVKELRASGLNIAVAKLDDLINWGRSNSVWPLVFGTSCCAIEFMSLAAARYDFSRFGWEVTRNSPRQADLIICCGTIVHKMAPVLKRLYDQLAEPKYVMAFGSCTIGGGPFKKSYHVVMGVNEVIPVDVYVPGCPPRPDAMIYGMMQLARKIKMQDFFKLPKQPHPNLALQNESNTQDNAEKENGLLHEAGNDAVIEQKKGGAQ
ncbi:MAG: NADH-quinone oxidoreductase subunit B [Dysgonamonadaceae bacterium]|jgi:NADH-quinone oxidoreductase subunit B|nr:NADH-quinone oxidoreductase subunit B [Dysgonamonadaceae bacterium]